VCLRRLKRRERNSGAYERDQSRGWGKNPGDEDTPSHCWWGRLLRRGIGGLGHKVLAVLGGGPSLFWWHTLGHQGGEKICAITHQKGKKREMVGIRQNIEPALSETPSDKKRLTGGLKKKPEERSRKAGGLLFCQTGGHRRGGGPRPIRSENRSGSEQEGKGRNKKKGEGLPITRRADQKRPHQSSSFRRAPFPR